MFITVIFNVHIPKTTWRCKLHVIVVKSVLTFY